MIALSEVLSYLEEICRRYESWWTVDALTTTIAERQATFSFKQTVETEERDTNGKPQKVLLPLFQGIQNYIESQHILLAGYV